MKKTILIFTIIFISGCSLTKNQEFEEISKCIELGTDGVNINHGLLILTFGLIKHYDCDFDTNLIKNESKTQ